MAASFQVNQPTEFTIKIGVSIQNGTLGLTMQPQVVPQQQHVQFHRPQLQNARPQPPPSNERALSDILRGINSLSIQRSGPEEAAVPPHILAGLDSLEPPAQLNLTKRRERVARLPQPASIPIVPDTEVSPRQQRRQRQETVLINKAPGSALPNPQGGTNKLSRGEADYSEQCNNEARLDDEILRELEEGDNEWRRRQPSSSYLSGGSPSSSHVSSSPPRSVNSFVPSPRIAEVGGCSAAVAASAAPPAVLKRPRGRPPGSRSSGPRATRVNQPAGGGSGGRTPILQPRPAAPTGGVVWIAKFVSPSDLAEAVKVINRYPDVELATPKEQGELLTHKFAREGNWPKLVALNMRWLNNASLGDIFTSINTANTLGHTPIIEAVLQENSKAVEYCCLFTNSCDVQLYRALVESALLPSDAIFTTILQAMCQEIDENGNPTNRTNRFIDQPIGGWSFRHPRLGSYAGLTLAQMLTLLPASAHQRLEMLIKHGADPRRSIDRSAASTYRPYIDCVCLAAAFSPAPYECLLALGTEPDDWCVSTIRGRADLSIEYRATEYRHKLVGSLPVLDADELEQTLGVLEHWNGTAA